MWFSSWLRKRTRSASRPRGSTRSRAAYRPTLETLEGRWLPSTLTVMNTADSGPGSLRAEIAAAQSGDTIVFAPRLTGHTITLTSGELVVNKSLDIEGPAAGPLTISGNHASRVFDIQAGAAATIGGLTIANGRVVDDGGGGIVNEAGASLRLVNDTVVNNTAYGIGGGLWNQIGGTLAVSNSTFRGNQALGSLTFSYPDEGFDPGGGTAEGGGIDSDGSATVSNSLFLANLVQGATGGSEDGAHGGALATDGPLTVTGSLFTANQARGGDGGLGGDGGQAEAGAINIDGPTTVANISDSTFLANQSRGGNGGADGGNGGIGAAGAVSMADATLTLTHSTFVGNQAIGGTGGVGGAGADGGNGGTGRGGAFVHTVTFGTSQPLSNLDDVTFLDNQALGGTGGAGGAGGVGGNGGNAQGGGIRALLGTINIDNSQLVGNQAIGGTGGAQGGNGGNSLGGGLLTTFGLTADVVDTVFLLNQAQGGAGASGGNGLGGGIFNDGASPFGAPDLTLTDCLVALNNADGGAASPGGSAGLGEGGGIYNLGALDLVMTQVAQNHASTSNDNLFP
jgi:hypothetical protein